NAVSNSSFHDNGSHGVIVGGSSINNTFQKTRVYGNSNDANAGGINDYQFAGIYIKGANTTIDSCYVYDNRGNGILLNDNAGTGLAANCTIRNSLVGMNPSGNLAGNGWNGLMVRYSTGVVIEDCIVVDNGKLHTAFPDRISGIRFQDLTGGTIRNNFIGTTAGKLNGGNDFDGITLHTNVSSVTITGNTINFNGLSSSIGAGGGIALRINSNNNTIQSNYIGMHPDLTDAGNNDYGISVEGCSGNMIGGVTANLGNNIGYSKNAGNKGCGVWISQAGATANELYNNNISFNTGDGVLIENGAAGNTIGSITAGNIINSNVIGINVKDNGASPTNVNSLRGNSFSCNTTEGIQLSDNGNNLYGGIGASKIVTTNASETRPTFVSGTAPANAAVDIYSRDIVCAVACDDTISQGVTYVTTVPADPTGAWEFDFSGTSITQVNIIVMATDTAAGANPQNSSEFSVCAVTCTAPQNVTIAGDDICVGGSETLVANSTGINPTGTYQYYWYLGSVALANEITPRNAPNDSDIVVSTAGTYIVVASETKDSAACSNTSPDFTFRVNALPVVTVNSETVCFGDAATFTATSDSTASDYLWSEQATGTGNVNAASGNTAGNYTVQITDINECIASATGVLTVNPLPTINFTDPTPSFCSGGSVQVNVSTDPGVTIVWSPTGEITNQITVTSAGVLIITATDGSPAGCISIDSITVVEDFLPIINLAKGTFCKGSSMTFDAGNAGKDFAWTPDNQTTQTITASVQGTYTVVVTDPVTGCFDQSSAFAEENPDADPEISISGNDSICFAQGETTELTATLTGGLDGRLEWSNGITEDLITTYSDTVTVWVMYTDTFNCADADTLQIYNYCEPRLDTLPNIFIPGGCPTCNPTFTPIGNLTPADVLSGHMEIYDRWGLLMYKTNDLVPEWDGKYNGRVVSSGVYFWIWQYTDVSRTYYNLNGFVEVLKKK
ncbi:MAG: gliding motility-associated-like protein, partial [Saprospiraceae bacterium]